MYEETHTYALAELAEHLKCKPEAIKPCLHEAFKLSADKLERDSKLTHAMIYFVGAELLTITPTVARARSAFHAWGRDKHIPEKDIQTLLDRLAKSEWSRRGCDRDKQVKRLCPGRSRCGYYERGAWLKVTSRKGFDMQTFHQRLWPEELVARFGKRLGQYAVRMYAGLYAFELKHGIIPGSKLFFTKEAGLVFCGGMRASIQHEALTCLKQAGLVRVPTWGRPRTKGKPNQPRVIQRVRIFIVPT